MATAEHTDLYQKIKRVLSGFGVEMEPILAEKQHGKTLTVLLNGKRSRVCLLSTTLSEKKHHHPHVCWQVPKIFDVSPPFFVPVLCVPGSEECFYALPPKDLRQLMNEKSRGTGNIWSGTGKTKALYIPHPPREDSAFFPFLNAGSLIA